MIASIDLNDLEKANQGKVTGVIIPPPEIEESIHLRGGVSDHKEYLYTTINGMKVLIISTKQLKLSGEDLVSAAALAVQTGSFNDPDEIQGLSHYLEHMIFMGSAKYPGENEYDAFVTSHGGSCNAFTEYEHTVYSFEIPQEYFFDALDIFANCFISPLFSSDSSDRELKAIESEFQLARTSDDARLEDMLCQLAHPSHLLHRFAWGNMESLKNEPLSRGIDVNSSLRQYFDRFYFPDNSQLVVTAPYAIQTILEGITASFSAWQGSSSSLVSPLQVQFPFPSTPYLLRNVPIEQRTHSLKIIWTIPPTLSDYRSKSHEYLSHLIGHEGSGSILSGLKDLNLAYEITAGVGSSGLDSNSYFSLFSTTIELTPRGVILWTQVVKIVFQYISLLRHHGPQEWIFAEIQKLAQIQYDFEDEVEVDDLLTELVVDMTTPYGRLPQDLLRARHVADHWNPEGIVELLTYFTPRNCHISLSSSLFEDEGDEEEEDEPRDSAEDRSGDEDEDDESYESDDDDDGDDDYDEESDEELLTHEEELALLATLPEAHKELSTRPVSSKSDATDASSVFHSKHFQMSYWKDLINEELLSYWADDLSLSSSRGEEGLLIKENSLHLPAPNQYIPTDLKILKPKKQQQHASPQIVFTSPIVRVWHLSASRFHIPKSVVSFSLLSDYLLQVTSQDSEVPPSPSVFVFHDLLSRVVSDFLLQELYVAEMAYLESKIVSRMNGIVVSIYGFHDKMLSLASLILKAFSEDTLLSNGSAIGNGNEKAERIISQQIEKLKRDYLNDSLLSSDATNTKRLQVLLPHQVSKALRLEALNQLCGNGNSSGGGGGSHKKFVIAFKKYLRDFLSSCRCEVFVQGNLSSQSAIAFGKSIKTELEHWQQTSASTSTPKKGKLKAAAAASRKPHNTRSSQFVSPSSVFVRTIEPSTSLHISPKSFEEKNVCCQLYFQIGPTNPREYALLELIQRIMEEPLFNELRTQKQLGYDISCFNCETYSVLGYTLEVVSSSHSAAEIQEDMLSFVNSSFVSLLRTMTSEQYRTFQHAVISRLEIPPISLYEAANEHWNEIEERRYSFQTKSDRLAVLRELRFEEVVAFYENYFLEGSSRRMMAINCSPVAA